MRLTREGQDLIKQFEGLRLKAYTDVAGVPTLGWGHTIGVKAGDVCTEEQAEQFFEEDIDRVEASLARMLSGVSLNDNEWSALVSLVFNVGAAAVKPGSSIYSALKHGDRPGAADAILLWDKAHIGGKLVTIPGLARRRAAERELFLRPLAA